MNFIAGKISVSNELLTWLVDSESLWKLLSSQVYWEWITSVIWEMDLADLYCVISKEILPDELKIITFCEESQHFSVVVKELFLRWNSSSSKFFLEEFKKFWVLLWWDWFAWYNKVILWCFLAWDLFSSTIDKEFSSVLIAIINSNCSSTDSNIKTNLEIKWLEWHIWTVLFNNYLSLQEAALWSSRVDLFWFWDEDWSVFKEIVDNEFPDSIVFKSWLYNWFFEISEKAENLFIKLNEGWLEEGAIVLGVVIWILGMTQTFAHVILWLQEVSLNLSREGMEWDDYVSGISNLLQFDVWNFLVVDHWWVMGWDESWKFRNVGLILWLHV